MNRYLLIALTAVSVNAFAVDCFKVPHAKMPSKTLSLYDKKTDNLQDYAIVRNIFIKNGWLPVLDPDNSAFNFPEENCISDRCIYEYYDKYQNRLYIEKVDDISFVKVDCTLNDSI